MSTDTLDQPEVASEVIDAAPKTTAVATLDPLHQIKAVLATLPQEAKSFDLTTTAGDKAARAFRAKCVSIRTSAKEAYETANRPLLDIQRQARQLVADINAEVAKYEEPVDAAIKAVEAKKEAEKKAKEAAARERVEAVQTRIAAIRAYVVTFAGGSAAQLKQALLDVQAIDTSEAAFEEFSPAASRAAAETITALQELHDGAEKREAEAARLAAERAELDRLRAEHEARERAERARAEAEAAAQREQMEREQAQARAAQEEADRIAKAARDAADAKAAAERAEADRIAAEARAAEQAKLDAERAALAKQQAEAAAAKAEADRIEREAREAREREEAAAKAEADRIAAEQAAAVKAAEDARIAAEGRVREAAQQLLVSLIETTTWMHQCKSMDGPGVEILARAEHVIEQATATN